MSEDSEIAKRLLSIVRMKFPTWFTAKWLTYEYQKIYGDGISIKKISTILEALRDDGYLVLRSFPRKKTRRYFTDATIDAPGVHLADVPIIALERSR